MGNVLKWLKNNRAELMEYFVAKKPDCAPSIGWWLVVLVVQPLVERIETTFKELQGMNLLICEQRQKLSKLEQDLMGRCHIFGPMTLEQALALDEAIQTNPHHALVFENFAVTKDRVRFAIDNVGGYVQLTMDALMTSNRQGDKETHDQVIRTVGFFALQVVVGVRKIVVEQDSKNTPSDEMPPVLPMDLSAMNSRDFTALLQKQRLQLRQKFTEHDIEQIDEQFRSLRLCIREQPELKSVLEGLHNKANSSFEECWSPLGHQYNGLKTFCGGIASVMATTSTVEADFSLINWVKDPNSQSLTDFSLEAILHCKQYQQLQQFFS